MLKQKLISRQEFINELNRLNKELLHIPSRNEYLKFSKSGIYKSSINNEFGSYTKLLIAAGYKKEFIPETKKCLNPNCNNVFTTRKDHPDQKFCSKACSNSMSKLKHGKFAKAKQCLNCGEIHDRNSDFCSYKCKSEHFAKNTKLKDIYCKGQKQNKYRGIRDAARNYAKYILKNTCQNCGYDKHVEIAHIKPIRDFSKENTLYDVNNPGNLLALCPNCHWEFDNGLLKM